MSFVAKPTKFFDMKCAVRGLRCERVAHAIADKICDDGIAKRSIDRSIGEARRRFIDHLRPLFSCWNSI